MSTALSTKKVLILGLPNSGKSRLFSRLTGRYAEVANAPLTTIDLNAAPLALGKGIETREFRDCYTGGYGTRLVFDGTPYPHGPAGHTGKKSCLFYGDRIGCTLHPYRPLACRLYPLGRDRHEGNVRYFYRGEKISCFELCPSIGEMPLITPEDYVPDQQIEEPAAAHDGYATLACGMVTAAATIARQSQQLDYAELQAFYRELCAESLEEYSVRITPLWMDRLTLPELDIRKLPASQFVNAHGQLLAEAISVDFSQTPDRAVARRQAAHLYLALALHLGRSVGLEPIDMAQFLA